MPLTKLVDLKQGCCPPSRRGWCHQYGVHACLVRCGGALQVLYLGAASGTSVSHCSDIVGPTGSVYAVEFSHRSGAPYFDHQPRSENISRPATPLAEALAIPAAHILRSRSPFSRLLEILQAHVVLNAACCARPFLCLNLSLELPRSGRDLVNMAKKRPNVIPIIEDARHPQKYRMLVPMVDVVFADVAQPDQVCVDAFKAPKPLSADAAKPVPPCARDAPTLCFAGD